MIRFSILVPVYNVGARLARGLESVLAQTYARWEVVCVDDGSTDGSAATLDAYAERCPHIRVFHQENRGTLIARKEAVARARGDWCLFLDPDDGLEPQALARLAEIAAGTKAEVVSYGFNVRPEGPANGAAVKAAERYFNGASGTFPVAEAYDRVFVSRRLPWNLIGKMVRTDVCKAAFADQPAIYSIDAEDMYALFHILARAATVEVVADRLYDYSYGVGISTKTDVTLAEWRRSLRKLDTLAELRDFRAKGGLPDAADRALAHAAGRMIGSLFVKLATRMPSGESRRTAWRELRNAVPEADLVRALALCYERRPLALAHDLARQEGRDETESGGCP